MSNSKKTWFLVPSWDIPPSAIQLGNVIADPTFPQRPLVRLESVSHRENVPQHPSANTQTQPSPVKPVSSSKPVMTAFNNSLDADVHSVLTLDFNMNLSTGQSNTFGLFAEFLQIFGFGGEASVHLGRDEIQSYAFKSMETQWFAPAPAFARRALEDKDAQGFLKMMGAKTPLYLITGLKTVWGVTVSSTVARAKGSNFRMGVDATGLGIPVSTGPKVGYERTKNEGTNWSCEGPIVFAYQIERIRQIKSGLSSQQYTKGALFDANRMHSEDVDVEFCGENVEDQNGYFDFRSVMDETKQEECLMAVPHSN